MFYLLMIILDSWMYPLRQKSDVFLCFTKFKSLVENLFSCKIKQFQTDNGGEYISHAFTKFLETMVYYIVLLVHMHLNKTALQSANTSISLKLACLC